MAVFLKKKGDVQVGAADTLGSMGAASKEAKTAIHEAGGADKLKELCSAASVASATVKKAAKRALADMGTAFLIHPIDSPSKLPVYCTRLKHPAVCMHSLAKQAPGKFGQLLLCHLVV